MKTAFALAAALLGGAGMTWAEGDAAAPVAAAVSPLVVPTDRTTSVVGILDLGPSIERAIPGRAFGLGVAQDRDEHWAEAAALYQQAIAEWSADQRAHPSPALERAIQKAERERQRSQMLANLTEPRNPQPATINRAMTLERARLFRTKLMVVRAYDGVAPATLLAHTRAVLRQALQASSGTPGTAAQTEVYLLTCATDAAGGDRAAARLALAHVTRDQRQDPANALPMAICQAALGKPGPALANLEAHLRQRSDPFSQRDLYLANDWDPLRTDRRFENLFAQVPRY